MSDHIFSDVSSISIIVYKGSITPIMAMGTFIADNMLMLMKKHPIGTPALPMAVITEAMTHISIVMVVRWYPLFCITYTTVVNMKAAQPFILIVVHIGSTNFATLGLIPNCFSATAMVTGSVPVDDLEKNPVRRAEVDLRII